MEIKLNNSQNITQSISLFNPNKNDYLFKSEAKKESKEKKELQFFSSKKKLINTNLVLSNITNYAKEKKYEKSKTANKLSINSKSINRTVKKKMNSSMKRDRTKIDTVNIRIGTSIQKLNLNHNKENNSNIKINSPSTKFAYNKYLITEIKSTKNYKSLYSKIPITPNKTTFKNKSKELNKNNNIICIKNKFSRSMIDNNSCDISGNDISKNNIKFKNKSNRSLNKLNSNNINNNSNKKENITNSSNNPHEKILVIDLDETLIHTSFKKIPNPDFKILLDSIKYTKKNSDNESIQELPVQNKVEAYIRIRPGVNEFLSQLSKYYDLYVYSASSKQYLNSIIKNIDKNNIIKKCYCREDCIIYV